MARLKWIRPKLSADDPGAGGSTKQLFEGKNSVGSAIFVREDLQNRVDARREDVSGPVEVTIRKVALPSSLIRKYLPPSFQEGFIQTETQALAPDKAAAKAKKIKALFKARELPVLLIEDFGTTGLNGPINSKIPVKNSGDARYHPTNALTCFLRRNGRSGKSDKALGSAGLGRHVYYKGSAISTKFVYTVPTDQSREEKGGLKSIDPRPMFFGQSVQQELEEREADGQVCYSGYLHLTAPKRIGDFPTPFGLDDASEGVVEDAVRDFRLKRGPDEPGCSIVIPFPRETLEPDRLRAAIVKEFALPILSGDLVVEVQDGRIDDQTLIGMSEVEGVNEGNRFLQGALVEEPMTTVTIDESDLDRSLNSGDFDGAELKRLARAFHEGELVCVAVEVHYGSRPEQSGVLHVAAKKTPPGIGGRGVVARKGLLLTKPSEARFSKPQNSCVLMRADADGEMDPLAALLRSVETPSHDDWIAEDIQEEDCAKPKALLDRVKSSHLDLVAILTNLDTEDDTSIFNDLLPSGSGFRVVDPPTGEPNPFSIRMPEGNEVLDITTASSYEGEGGEEWDVLVVLDSIQGAGRARRSFRQGTFDLRKATLEVAGGSAKVSSECLLQITVNDPAEFALHLRECGLPGWADVRVQATLTEPVGG